MNRLPMLFLTLLLCALCVAQMEALASANSSNEALFQSLVFQHRLHHIHRVHPEHIPLAIAGNLTAKDLRPIVREQ